MSGNFWDLTDDEFAEIVYGESLQTEYDIALLPPLILTEDQRVIHEENIKRGILWFKNRHNIN